MQALLLSNLGIIRIVRKKIFFFIIYWLPVILVAGIIYKLSAGTVPVTSNVYWQDFFLKKLAHISVYGLLAAFIYRALVAGGTLKKKAIILAIVLATLYGGTDEIHQHFTQGRESRITDVGFDGIGACVAMFLVINIFPRLPKGVIEFGKRLGI